MNVEQPEEKKAFFSPSETAAQLGVSVDQLRQMRWQGRIEGTSVGNSTVYTAEQIAAADLSPWTRGRKRKKKTQREPETKQEASYAGIA